jgi:hypothetical protein
LHFNEAKFLTKFQLSYFKEEIKAYQKELSNIRESKSLLIKSIQKFKENRNALSQNKELFQEYIEFVDKSVACLDSRIELNESAFFNIHKVASKNVSVEREKPSSQIIAELK